MATFNEAQFEKKLLNLKDTQDSISSLSSWCLQQPQNHKKIVQIWLQVLKKVKIEQRLTLFYLANDVIQYSKRKGYDFVESWGTALQRATTMVRGNDRVRTKVLRLFTIWDERSIYDESFLVDLVGLLSSRTPAQTSVPDAQDFQPGTLISKVRSCKQLEDDTDLRLKIVNESHLQLSDADALRCSLKDRRQGEDVIAEVEEGIEKMQNYIKALDKEIKERAELIELLDLADVFYETQRGEARIVCNAYSNFGKRVKQLKRKLDELIPSLPSPLPSPDVNAPSPSPESDIQLPDDVNDVPALGMSSFIGSMVLPDQSPKPYVPPQPLVQMSHSVLEEVPVMEMSAHNQAHYQVPSYHHQPPQVSSTPSPIPQPHHKSRGPSLINTSLEFPVNGSNSFLNSTANDNSPVPPFLDSASSFIGNMNFSFDFMKEDSELRNELDTPASPSPRSQMPDDGVDEFSAATPKEGKPIEVITSNANESTGFSLSEFLKNLIPDQTENQSLETRQASSNDTSMVEPSLMIDTAGSLQMEDTFPSVLPLLNETFTPTVPPPPMEEPFPEKLWNSSTLPPKFPSWNDSQPSWGDTPQSTYKEPFLFDVPPPNAAENIEMRAISKMKMKDIDHRNLISLTGSPRNENSNSWQNTPRKSDADFRPNKRLAADNKDIVESVDMDLSDDDEHLSHAQFPMSSSTPKSVVGANTVNKTMKPMALGHHVADFVPKHRNTPRSILNDQPCSRNNSNNTVIGPSISFNIMSANKLVKESPLKESEEPKKKLPLLHKVNSASPSPKQVSPSVPQTASDLLLPDISLPPPVISSLLSPQIKNVLSDFSGLPPPPPPPPEFPVASTGLNKTPAKAVVDCTELMLAPPPLSFPPELKSRNQKDTPPDQRADDKTVTKQSEKDEVILADNVQSSSLLKTPELFLEEVLNPEPGDISEPNDIDAAAMLYEDLCDESVDSAEGSFQIEAVGQPLANLNRISSLLTDTIPPPPPASRPPPGFRPPPPPPMRGQMWRPRRMFPPRMGPRPMGAPPHGAGNFPRQMSPRPPFRANWRPRFPNW